MVSIIYHCGHFCTWLILLLVYLISKNSLHYTG